MFLLLAITVVFYSCHYNEGSSTVKTTTKTAEIGSDGISKKANMIQVIQCDEFDCVEIQIEPAGSIRFAELRISRCGDLISIVTINNADKLENEIRLFDYTHGNSCELFIIADQKATVNINTNYFTE